MRGVTLGVPTYWYTSYTKSRYVKVFMFVLFWLTQYTPPTRVMYIIEPCVDIRLRNSDLCRVQLRILNCVVYTYVRIWTFYMCYVVHNIWYACTCNTIYVILCKVPLFLWATANNLHIYCVRKVCCINMSRIVTLRHITVLSFLGNTFL